MMVWKRRPKHVVSSKLHLVNRILIHSQAVCDSLCLSLQLYPLHPKKEISTYQAAKQGSSVWKFRWWRKTEI